MSRSGYGGLFFCGVCHRCTHTSRPNISLCSCFDITSKMSLPRWEVSLFHLNRQNSNCGDGVDVGSQLKRSVHARSCQTNGGFALRSLADHAIPHPLPHPSLPITGRFTQPPSSFSLSLSPSFSSSLKCSSRPSRSSVHPLWHNTKQ